MKNRLLYYKLKRIIRNEEGKNNHILLTTHEKSPRMFSYDDKIIGSNYSVTVISFARFLVLTIKYFNISFICHFL